MASTFGTRLRTTIFGQSHSEAIGCVVEGLPAGIEIDHDQLARFMERRAPGRNRFSTQRREADAYRIVGGLNERGLTCGTPLAALIENTNTRSADYDELRRVPRPGHADFGAWVKWGDARDVNGGGHFSARMTAPLCVAGGIAIQVLEAKGVRVAAHVAQVGDVLDERLETRDNTPAGRARLARQVELIESRAGEPFCTLSEEAAEAMAKEVDEAREAGDSVGGAIECVCTGLPAGIGGPRYDGVQAAIARICFSLPAVRALEFGAGFEVASMRGSQNNDPFEVRDGHVVPATNNAGGTLGGITTGAAIAFRLAVKPTPSIALPQRSVDLETLKERELRVRGRHDPCVAARAVPIVEAACALAVLDSWLAFPPASDDLNR